MFLIYVANQNVLIDCVCKVVLDRQPSTIKVFFFFLQKQNDIHYFKLIKYIRCNNIINIIAKNVKGEFVNKLT